MPSLQQLTPKESSKYAGKPGLGTRIFVKEIGKNPASGPMIGDFIGAMRDLRQSGIVTNPAVASHHLSADGFVDVYPSLKDPGTTDFDYNWFPAAGDYNDGVEWQRSNDIPGHPQSQLMRSLMGTPIVGMNSSPICDLILVPPASTRAIYFCRGFTSMNSSGQPMEGVMQGTISMKMSGKPYVVSPINIGQDDGAFTGAIPVDADKRPLLEDKTYIFRAILEDKYEVWTRPITLAAGAPASIAIANADINNDEAGAFQVAIGTESYDVLAYRAYWAD